jgi:hypothetical protein
MGKKGKAQRKPKQGETQAPRPGQDAFGESSERSAYQGQSQQRADAFGETSQRSAQPGRAQQPNRGQQQQQRGKRPAQQQDEV